MRDRLKTVRLEIRMKTEKVLDTTTCHDDHDGNNGPIVSVVLKEGWLSKRGQRMPIWKMEEYFVLTENGSFFSFSSKPESCLRCAKPKQAYIMRAIPCLGIFTGFDYYKTIQKSFAEQNLESNDKESRSHSFSEFLNQPSNGISVRVKRHTFCIRLLKNGEFVERTYETNSAEDREEWIRAFSEVKRLLSMKQKTLNDFELLSVLGQGFFGKVILCRERSSGHAYAMKLIRKSKVAGFKELKRTLAEKHFLQKLSHPFLIRMKFSFQTTDNLCFVTEYLGGGELYRLVHTVGHLTENNTRFYSSEVIEAIGFLHQCNVIYRDLKLENLLIDREGHIRLVDLGLCKDLESSSQKTRTFCGTRECMAPEMLDYDLYGFSVDWWGVGIIMYEMLCGRLPFSDSSIQGLLSLLKNEDVTFDRILGSDATDLVRSLLVKDPQFRLGCCGSDVREVQLHPFFKDISWEDVVARKLKPPFVPELSSDIDTRYFDDQFTAAPVEPSLFDTPDENLTSLERNKFERISDYCEESGGCAASWRGGRKSQA